MAMLGFDDWKCVCGCVNYEFRKRCRDCNETQEFASLADAISTKTREIEASVDVSHWRKYQTPEQ